MKNVSLWIQMHNIFIDVYIEEKQPNCAPSHVWLLSYIMAVFKFSRLATAAFKSSQGHQVTVLMHRQSIISLQTSLLHSVAGRGSLSESEAAELDASHSILFQCSRFSASSSATKQLNMNLWSFVTIKLALLDASAVEHFVDDIADLYLASAARVSSIVAECDNAIESDEALLLVVPHQWATISHSQFCTILSTHRERLVASGWTPILLQAMEQGYKDLARSTVTEPPLRAAIDVCDDDILFDADWPIERGRFKSLQRFAGEITSVSPGMVQKESDFLVFEAEKDDLRSLSPTFRIRASFTRSSSLTWHLSRHDLM